ncbi:MAG: acyl-CoA carboxylase subunit beta, partial [Deltaproteobacteria bacterium]|nr:acyl-CoA carboxylase subunit beta [Deltaproteobacteria bacterium]
MSKQTTHKSELNRLAALKERAELGGGAKAIEKRHARKKLTARERLNLLFDPHT